jgi:ABC-type uncharacterized transport system substrate-binding protein
MPKRASWHKTRSSSSKGARSQNWQQKTCHRIAEFPEYPEAGGQMSYGENLAEAYRLAATYVDKIFKGAKAGNLLIEQPTKLELVINRETAKALGIKIPESILLRVDKAIE